jgi:hypothetical protein
MERSSIPVGPKPGRAMLSPLDGSGIDLHKPPLLLDRLCTPLISMGCRRGPQERPETLFFAVTQDFNGLRGRLRGPIVFADVRTLKAFAA